MPRSRSRRRGRRSRCLASPSRCGPSSRCDRADAADRPIPTDRLDVTDRPDHELAAVVRREVARIVATTSRWCGDLALAEDAVADAVVEALATWRRSGVPPRPGGWLQLAARRNALDRLRRDQRQHDKLSRLEPL